MAFDKGGTCWSCGAALAAEDYRRGDVCAGCRRETRCCRNCEFYDAARSNRCRETAAEPPADKEASNFCEFFRPAAPAADPARGFGLPRARDAASPPPLPQSPSRAGDARPPGSTAKDSAKAALDALFKKKS